MKLITREIRASEALKRFNKEYAFMIGNKKDILDRLKSLGSNPNPDDVDKAIGNKTWTCVPSCTECGKDYSKVLEFEDYDYIFYLCEKCINMASESI